MQKQFRKRTKENAKAKTQISSSKAVTKVDRALFLAVMQAWAMFLHALAVLVPDSHDLSVWVSVGSRQVKRPPMDD